MGEDRIGYDDVREYEHLFKLAPSFLLERFAKKEKNVVSKFKSQVESHLNNLSDAQKEKLEIILSTDVGQLQEVMAEAYRKTEIKQYKILANPKYRGFVELNLREVKKIFQE